MGAAPHCVAPGPLLLVRGVCVLMDEVRADRGFVLARGRRPARSSDRERAAHEELGLHPEVLQPDGAEQHADRIADLTVIAEHVSPPLALPPRAGNTSSADPSLLRVYPGAPPDRARAAVRELCVRSR